MGAPYAFFDNIITLRSGINPGVTTRKSFRFGVDRGVPPGRKTVDRVIGKPYR